MSWSCDVGQLCPYSDCAWNCGIPEPGWYICPHCGREFWARVSDSDYEYYHSYRADQHVDEQPPKPIVIPMALDCGPSWATPANAEV